jgi:hypothetical protein
MHVRAVLFFNPYLFSSLTARPVKSSGVVIQEVKSAFAWSKTEK